MRARRLFENPDHVCLTGNYTNQSKCADGDPITYLNGNAYPFGYYQNEMILGSVDQIHPNVVPGGRHVMDFSGRIWLDKKLISFWSYPNPGKIRKVLIDLEYAFKNGIFMIEGERKKSGDIYWDDWSGEITFKAIDINIINDPSYKIEVLTEAPAKKEKGHSSAFTGDWSKYGYTEEHHSEFISLKTYEYRNRMYQRSQAELDIDHPLSPMLKTKKTVADKGNSEKRIINRSLRFKQALLTSENILHPPIKYFL